MQKLAPKFRAWHKELKIMCDVYNICFGQNTSTGFTNDNQFIACENEHWELMQWTGLQSADAVDVYQGDILAYDHGGGVDTFVIERCIHSNQLIAKYLYMNDDWEHLDDAPVECSKIIGNIYSNPELLEQK